MKKMKLPMTLSQKRKLLASTGLPMLAVMLVLGFQNCSPGIVKSTAVEQASTGNNENDIPDLDGDMNPVTLSTSENYVTSVQQQLGLQTLSARAITASNEVKNRMGETGKVDSLNAPSEMGRLNFSTEACLDLITDEKAKAASARRYFGQVDFAQGPSALTLDAKNDMIRRMARNMWSRNETNAERTVIRSEIDSFIAAAPAGAVAATETENTVLFACTAMLASLDSIRYR